MVVVDAATGISSMVSDVQTLFSGNTSLLDKVLAVGAIALNVTMDVFMVVGLGEGLKAADVGVKAAAHIGEEVGAHIVEQAGEDAATHVLEHEAEDTAEHAAEDAVSGAADGAGACSFAAGTLVALPGGSERPIASLEVGQAVIAYNPTTHASTPQAIQAVSLHHDDNVVDVTLPVVNGVANAASTAKATPATGMAGHPTTTTIRDETVHTTTTHPWLTADHAWLPAAFLRVGEPVLRADGTTAVVVRVRVVPGAADMWDLTVAQVHTFAVGSGQFVVHNCPDGTDAGNGKGRDPRTGEPGSDANEFNKQEGADLIKNTDRFKSNYSSDYQWEYLYVEGPDHVVNELGHEARFTQRYYFKFMDEGANELREISANFDPWEREWEEATFKFSSGKW